MCVPLTGFSTETGVVGDLDKIEVDTGVHCDNYRNRDVSFLYFDSFILFYKFYVGGLYKLHCYDVATKTIHVFDREIVEKLKTEN